MFADVRHKRSLIILLSKTDPNKLKQSNFTDDEMNMLKNLALENLLGQCILKEYVASSLLENNFPIIKWHILI